MLSIDPESLSEKENYKFLTGTLIPRPIAFITSLAEDGTLNGAPFSYFTIVSANPPLIGISVQRKADGEMKDTARNILMKKEFVVHITDEENVSMVNETAATVPNDVSEIDLAGLTPVQSKEISIQGVTEAKVRYECKLHEIVKIQDDQGNSSCDFIIGRIVQYHIASSLRDHNGYIDCQTLAPVSRLAGNDYAALGHMFTIKRPQ